MTHARACRALAFAAILLAALAMPAAASPPEAVTFHLTADFSGAVPVFLWSGSGAVTDAGTWVGSAPLWGAVPSPVVGTFHQSLTLIGAHGTVSLGGDGLLTLTDDPGIYLLTGRWRARGGTGAYAGARGGGSFTVVFYVDPAIPDPGTFTGALHFDPAEAE